MAHRIVKVADHGDCRHISRRDDPGRVVQNHVASDPRSRVRQTRELAREHARMPVERDIADLQKAKRIFWIDDRHESVAALCASLGVKTRPPFVVAFFPAALEKQLLEKELAFANREQQDIREEADIENTKFEIQRSGTRYVPVVIEQKQK